MDDNFMADHCKASVVFGGETPKLAKFYRNSV